MSVSSVMDEALVFVRDRFVSLMLASIAAAVPVWAALYFGLVPAGEKWADLISEGMFRPEDVEDVALHVGAVLIPLSFLAYRICEPIVLGALIFIVAGTIVGKRPTVGESLRRSLRRSGPLIVMWFVRWVCVQIGALACYIPGLVLAGLFAVAAPAVVLERKGPFGALGRSIELNKQRLLASTLLILLLGFIEWVMAQLGQLLPNRELQSIAMSLMYAATLTLYAAAVTVFYFSGRCQVENYDLQLLAEQVAVGPDEIDDRPEQSPTLFAAGPG